MAAKRVLRYINDLLDSAIVFKKHASPTDALCLTAYSDSNWAGDPLIDGPLLVLLYFWDVILFLGLPRNSRLFLEAPPMMNTGLELLLLPKFSSCASFLKIITLSASSP